MSIFNLCNNIGMVSSATACVENVVIRGQFEHNANFAFAYTWFHLQETQGECRKHPTEWSRLGTHKNMPTPPTPFCYLCAPRVLWDTHVPPNVGTSCRISHTLPSTPCKNSGAAAIATLTSHANCRAFHGECLYIFNHSIFKTELSFLLDPCLICNVWLSAVPRPHFSDKPCGFYRATFFFCLGWSCLEKHTPHYSRMECNSL